MKRKQEQVIDILQSLADKFGVSTEYDSNNNFTFKEIPVGLGHIIEDEVSIILIHLGIYTFSTGLHPTNGQLTIKWQEE